MLTGLLFGGAGRFYFFPFSNRLTTLGNGDPSQTSCALAQTAGKKGKGAWIQATNIHSGPAALSQLVVGGPAIGEDATLAVQSMQIYEYCKWTNKAEYQDCSKDFVSPLSA